MRDCAEAWTVLKSARNMFNDRVTFVSVFSDGEREKHTCARTPPSSVLTYNAVFAQETWKKLNQQLRGPKQQPTADAPTVEQHSAYDQVYISSIDLEPFAGHKALLFR